MSSGMRRRIEEKSDLKEGIKWNLVSYVLLGILTIFSYCLITWYYGKAALGAYNLVLSIFMICGHIGVFGLQSAAIYYIPRQLGDKEKLGKCFVSFLSIVIVVSILLSGIIILLAKRIGGTLFESAYVIIGLQIMAPSIVLFSVNKLIVGYINGAGKMRQVAILQGMRYFFIVAYISLVAMARARFFLVFYAFMVSEIGVLILGVLFLKHTFWLKKPEKKYISEGIQFGSRAMLGNVLSDINTRVDVMMLGMLCNDEIVGLYSFVTIVAEGMFSILFVFRSNLNPIFAELLFKGQVDELCILIKNQRKKIRIFFGALSGVVLVGYIVLCITLLEDAYVKSILPVLVILIGSLIMAPYFVCGNICTLQGKPLLDTSITLLTILSNIFLNYVLILEFEILGAALATSTSYIIFSILTFGAIKKTLAILRLYSVNGK